MKLVPTDEGRHFLDNFPTDSKFAVDLGRGDVDHETWTLATEILCLCKEEGVYATDERNFVTGIRECFDLCLGSEEFSDCDFERAYTSLHNSKLVQWRKA